MMKTIRINGVEQQYGEDSTVFQDFLDGLNQQLNHEKQIISCIRIDGKEISEADESAMKKMPIEKIGSIEIDTASPAELAYETLNTLGQYTDRLIASVERAALHYKGKNHVTGDAYFARAIDGLDLFVQTISGVKLALRIGLNQKLALAEASLVSIMNDLLEAKRQNNYVFMADLLKNDLIQNLNEWNTSIFPMLRQWKVS